MRSNRPVGIGAAVLALLLSALLALSRSAARAGYADLLLVAPKTFGAPGLSTERLKTFSEDEFLLTYAIRQPATARALRSDYAATLVATNHNYAHIMGYPLLDGGFFTEAAMDSNQRHVVLGETAAFRMFGSTRIAGGTLQLEGEVWVVTGVIRDGDEDNCNLYVPAATAGGQAGSLMVLLDETVTEAYALNALKGVGIHDSGYDFMNLSRSAGAFTERFSVAWRAALTAAILLFLLAVGGRLRRQLRFYRNSLRELYLREMLALHRRELAQTAGGLLLFAAGAAAVLAFSLQILETCLGWQRLAPITAGLIAGEFGQRLLWLRDFQMLDELLFWGCVCLVPLELGLALRQMRKTGKMEGVVLDGKFEPA